MAPAVSRDDPDPARRLRADTAPGLLFHDASFQYVPFPFGLVSGILPPDLHSAMLDQFPHPGCFADVSSPDNGIKYLLKEPQLSAAVRKLGFRAAAWSAFLGAVYAPRFIGALDAFLAAHHVDLGLERLRDFLGPPLRSTRRRRAQVPQVRVEVSRIPAGGFQKPHTDVMMKILTILVPMNEPGAWPESAGGRVLICRPRDARNAFNPRGRYVEFDAMETVHAIGLEPNRGIVFPKTHNSWHAVEPVVPREGSPLVRRMLSIVVYWY